MDPAELRAEALHLRGIIEKAKTQIQSARDALEVAIFSYASARDLLRSLDLISKQIHSVLSLFDAIGGKDGPTT